MQEKVKVAMAGPFLTLKRLKYDTRYNLDECVIEYIHRGVPENKKIIHGRDIIELGKSFFKTAEAEIPYHRILTITWREEVLYKKKPYHT
ncbi:MAG: RNA repair domain-containing protein, partial [Thermoplasmata archaeon]